MTTTVVVKAEDFATLMLDAAQTILRRARNVVGEKWGVTVIVHARELRPGETEMAVASTLPGRRHYRALCGELVAQSVLADGYGPETAHEVAVADHEAILGESPRN